MTATRPHNNLPERITWMVFGILLAVAICAHEPWFDEVQAWQIALQAPLRDLLFTIPHYEGHPPFFHLLLWLPAHLGISGLWTLRTLGWLCGMGSTYLLLFKAPFTRAVRLCLPFSFFFFYQYGVIVRPYNLMVGIVFLLAVLFSQKDKRPFLFTGLLAALCACHVFGIAIAGGITVAWLWELKAKTPLGTFIRQFVKDPRFYAMLGLLVWAVVLLGMIFPRADAFAVTDAWMQEGSRWQKWLYLLFALPADTVLTNMYDVRLPLSALSFPIGGLISTCVVGILLWVLLLRRLPRPFWKYLFVPYLLLVCLMAGYASRHHIGLALLVVVFACWITGPAPQKPADACSKFVLTLCLLIPVGWTLHCLQADLKYPVFSGQKLLSFFQQHQLTGRRIFVPWFMLSPEDLHHFKHNLPPEQREDTHFAPIGTELSFYAPRNLFANLNEGNPYTYTTHIHPSHAENQRTLQVWRAGGLPEVMIGDLDLDHVFDRQDLRLGYAVVHQLDYYDLWKLNRPLHTIIPVFARKDILHTHALTPLDETAFYLQVVR